MPVINPQSLARLQQSPDTVRNICILAHVDHGKTSLSDSLLATNGIISPKLAGKIRYLDSRADEQMRGITMESSAISLYFSMLRRNDPADAEPKKQEYLINLIDSPGHVDFSSEVSTASRLCDGAIVLVDAVEGVCSQTVAVLRQTWIEHLKPILVINKMDRLVQEWKMSPSEAYSHLTKLLEQVNAVVGSFYQGERMEDDLKWRERLEAKVNNNRSKKDDSLGDAPIDTTNVEEEDDKAQKDWEEKGDEDIYFEPERGNVAFCSAQDGWAFTVKQFAGIYEKKLGIKRSLLEKVLWGDYYLDPKTKRILGSKHLKGRSLKPMFVQLVLDNIWAVYDATMGGDKQKGDPEKVEKITKALSLTLPAHILRSRDSKSVMTALFSAWIPLSTAVLVSVVEHLPSPRTAQSQRMPMIIDASPGAEHVSREVKDATMELNSSRSKPLVAFVSKMVSVPAKDLPQNKSRTGATLTAEEARELGRKKRAEIAKAQAAADGERTDVAELRSALTDSSLHEGSNGDSETASSGAVEKEHLVGFARLFSGTLEVGDEIYVLPPKFSPADPTAKPEPQKVTITALYLIMGRELEALTSAPPGVVFGIGGLEGHVMKSATLCSQPPGSVNLAGVSMGSQPIVRVALEPENPMDLEKMIRGLKILQQSDPCAMYEVLENGEHVVLTAGELHLERCLKDLRERFAKCEIQVGAPIIPYRESIVTSSEMNPKRDKDLPRGTVEAAVSSKQISLRVRVRPLPSKVVEYLLEKAPFIRELYEEQEVQEGDEEAEDSQAGDAAEMRTDALQRGSSRAVAGLKTLVDDLDDLFGKTKADRESWKNTAKHIIAFGPRRIGPNILIDSTTQRVAKGLSLGSILERQSLTDQEEATEENRSSSASQLRNLVDKVAYAFQLAMSSGPLCQEPMQGVAVSLEEMTIQSNNEDSNEGTSRLTSEIMKAMRNSITTGFLDWSPRMLLAMYSCEIQASAEVLGRVYGVITRRRGRILSESMNEGTPFFTITATIPVAESFGFSEEIRKRTSGAASPQLIFSGYEMLDEDPFWVPFTEEQLEDLGELADKENVAKKYMDAVRRRKGLFVQGKKLVESAEKQKTLKR